MHAINLALARRFERLADLLEIRGDEAYKIRAYRRAAETLYQLHEPVTRYAEEGRLRELPGIGPALARKIQEFLETGEISALTRLQREVPPTLLDLLHLPGLGPAKVRTLWKTLGITDLPSLEAALRAGKVHQVPGFGARTVDRLLKALAEFQARPPEHLLAHARDMGSFLVQWLRDVPGVHRAEITGPVRRWVPFVPHLDLLVAASVPPGELLSILLGHPLVETGRVQDDGRLELRDLEGLPIMVHLAEEASFGTAWAATTGSVAHWQGLQRLAEAKGWHLSPQGLGPVGEETPIPDEETLYTALDLPWIPPELREGRGEIEAARQGALPSLLPWDAWKADLHTHTRWSDGALDLRDLVAAAWKRGLRVIAITDHSPAQHVANGLSVERLRKQREEVEKVRAEWGDRILILHGAEVDILPDGSLDYPDEVLAELDIVIASPHMALRQDAKEATQRLVRAASHPLVDIIGHPRGRMWPRRPGLPLDMDALLRAALEHQVALEVNSNPHRLDLGEEDLRRAAQAGVLIAINTDAHHPHDFAYHLFGVALARRTWVDPSLVLNAWEPEELLSWLRSRKSNVG